MRDIRKELTERIVAQLEAASPWQRPWAALASTGLPYNATTGRRYRGANILSLSCSPSAHTPAWATFKQWQAAGASVRKGEHGSLIVWYGEINKRGADSADDSDDAQKVRVLRYSHVFNHAQVDGAAPLPTAADERDQTERHAAADALIAASGANIQHGGDSACYVPGWDEIRMPPRAAFQPTKTASATEHYYSTVLHELGHWTGHDTRLDRDLSGRFGTAAYAVEELVAELSAAFACAELGISDSPRPDHAQYLKHWLGVLKADSRALFTAAARASDIFEYLVARTGRKLADRPVIAPPAAQPSLPLAA